MPPEMRGLPSRSVALVTKELFPVLMQGELGSNRRFPAAKSTNSGALVMLPTPLAGCGVVQQWLRTATNWLMEKFAPSVAVLKWTMQLFRMPPYAPPPEPGPAELPVNVQLFSVPPYVPPPKLAEWLPVDRKSTRLNSSHGYISYAVFCL